MSICIWKREKERINPLKPQQNTTAAHRALLVSGSRRVVFKSSRNRRSVPRHGIIERANEDRDGKANDGRLQTAREGDGILQPDRRLSIPIKLYNRNGVDCTFAVEIDGVVHTIYTIQDTLEDSTIQTSGDASQLDKQNGELYAIPWELVKT